MDPNAYKVPDLPMPAVPSAQDAPVVVTPHDVQLPPVAPAVAPQPVADPIQPTQPIAAAAVAQIAADEPSDNLDQEWVSKAKAIVEQAKVDPHALSKELSKVKADYLKIRYNKENNIAQDN